MSTYTLKEVTVAMLQGVIREGGDVYSVLGFERGTRRRPVVRHFTQEGKVQRQLKVVHVAWDVIRNTSQSNQLA